MARFFVNRPIVAIVISIITVMVGLVALCLMGPYAFLPGAFALDFGGKQAGAVASGLVDGTGYLGGVLSGYAMGKISVAFGWGGVFVTLATVAAVTNKTRMALGGDPASPARRKSAA